MSGPEDAVPAGAPAGVRFERVDAGELTLRCAMLGSGPLVLMVHGFPESWYSWRRQMGPVAEAGFTACAIDVRGYGGSDTPPEVADYAMAHMVADVVGVAQALSPDRKVILVGHDWGAPIVWNTAMIRTDVVRAVAGLSVPFFGPPTVSFREVYEKLFTAKGRFFYQHYFQEPGVAEAEAEADVEGFLRRFYYALSGDAPDGTWPRDKVVGDPLLKGLPDPDPFPAWLTAEDLAYYTAEFTRSGLRGPLNRYRNHDADFDYLKQFAGRRIEQPALLISGTRDLAFNMMGGADPITLMRPHMGDLRGAHVLDGCGHWTQQERPEEVTRLLLEWLKGL